MFHTGRWELVMYCKGLWLQQNDCQIVFILKGWGFYCFIDCYHWYFNFLTHSFKTSDSIENSCDWKHVEVVWCDVSWGYAALHKWLLCRFLTTPYTCKIARILKNGVNINLPPVQKHCEHEEPCCCGNHCVLLWYTILNFYILDNGRRHGRCVRHVVSISPLVSCTCTFLAFPIGVSLVSTN